MTDVEAFAANATRSLGERIRRARLDGDLTLVDVAGATGLSVSMLSMLERGKCGVSVGSLVAVASAIGVEVGDLFSSSPNSDLMLVRRNSTFDLTIGPGVTRRLIHRSREDGVEIVELRLEPGAHTGVELVRHEGHEVVLVRGGALTVQVVDDLFELATGDSLGLNADHPHRFSNNGDVVSHTVVVMRLSVARDYGH